jgi:ribose-phosphate pyrophosphokinase
MSIKLLFAHQMTQIAEEIYSMTRASRSIELVNTNWRRFADGWSNTKVPSYEQLRHQDVVFLACWDHMDDALEQIMFLSTLTDQFKVRSLKVILPYYPTGMKDRWEEEGEVVTGYQLAQLMRCIRPTMTGPVDLVIYDIHALQEERYFPDNIRVERRSMIPAFNRELQLLGETCCIVLPDEGANKRYGKIFKGFPTVVCDKRRLDDGEKLVTIKEGDPAGMHARIIDDIGMTGGTLRVTKTALLKAGAAKVSVFFVHAVLPGDAADTLLSDGFEEIWTTNSHSNANNLNGATGCKILSMADDIAQVILEDYHPTTVSFRR